MKGKNNIIVPPIIRKTDYSYTSKCKCRNLRIVLVLSHIGIVDHQKLCCVCIAINYTPLSMVLYYTYDSTANFLYLGSTVLICISKEWHCKNRGVGSSFEVGQPISRSGDNVNERAKHAAKGVWGHAPPENF